MMSSQIVKWQIKDVRCSTKITFQIDPPHWNCQWQQVNYWLSNVWSESPFKTVIFTTALHCVLHCVQLYMLSFGVELLDRSVTHLLLQKMHQFLSICSCCCFCCAYDFILLLLCSVHNYTKTTTSRTTTTICSCCFCCAYDFILLLLCSVHNYTWTTTSRTTTTTRMRIKRFR